MTLALLIPGLLMGGGAGAAPPVSAYQPPVKVWYGVRQPDVPTVTGSGMN